MEYGQTFSWVASLCQYPVKRTRVCLLLRRLAPPTNQSNRCNSELAKPSESESFRDHSRLKRSAQRGWCHLMKLKSQLVFGRSTTGGRCRCRTSTIHDPQPSQRRGLIRHELITTLSFQFFLSCQLLLHQYA